MLRLSIPGVCLRLPLVFFFLSQSSSAGSEIMVWAFFGLGGVILFVCFLLLLGGSGVWLFGFLFHNNAKDLFFEEV